MNLYDPSVGAIFSISGSTWQLITFRCGATLVANYAQAVPQLQKVVPQFDALVSASSDWNSTTFNGLIALAPKIAQHAQTAVTELSGLQNAIAGLDQSQPVPAPLAALVKQAFAAIAQSAQGVASDAATLDPQLRAFCDANQPVSLAVFADGAQLRDVPAIAGAMGVMTELAVNMAQGIGVAAGAWGALVADLQSVINGSVQVDWPFLASLDIQTAIQGWTTVHAEATAFPANDPQWVNPCFMSGSWIIDGTPANAVFSATDPIGLFGQYLTLCCGFPPPYEAS